MEVLVELVKKIFNLKGGWVLVFAVVFGILFAELTLKQSIKYQLGWEIYDWASIVITGVLVSSTAKFFDYVYKITRLKGKN